MQEIAHGQRGTSTLFLRLSFRNMPHRESRRDQPYKWEVAEATVLLSGQSIVLDDGKFAVVHTLSPANRSPRRPQIQTDRMHP